MWICPKCNECIENQFDTCWKCAGQLQQAATRDKRGRTGSPLWSVLSLACPLCVIGIALLDKAIGHRGSGNLELFSPGIIVVVVSCLGFGVAGIWCGFVGLSKGRWPLVALAGLILSGLLFVGPFIH
jgi:hypothetical protein